jgi:hypothetical protein
MHLTARSLMLFVVGVALFCTGCGSNNKGKIVGKWKVVSATGESDNSFKQMEQMKISLFFDFKDDNSVSMSVESTEERPKGAKQEVNSLFSFNFKYKLLSGDMVEFYDLPKDLQQKGGGGLFGSGTKDRGREKIKISGDNMTIIEDKINMTLVRVK